MRAVTDEHAGDPRDHPAGFAKDQRVGVAVAPPNAGAALKRGARVADRWLVLVLTFFLVSLGMFLANPLIGIVPLIASVVGFVVQQRKALRYSKAASLCTTGASCTLDVEDMLLVANGQTAMKLTLGPRISRDLRQQRLPAARAELRKP